MMAAPTSTAEFIDFVYKSGVLDAKRVDAFVQHLRDTSTMPEQPGDLAEAMVNEGLLTHFQAEQFLLGKWRNFTISGKYKLLERLGAGGMGTVFLCEHKVMRRLVALKVLPTSQADDPASLERFHREARAVAQLHHPNIVGAYDIDQDGKLHFLVMEYVEGASLQEIVKRSGPMEPMRAAHYIRQAAIGLQEAHRMDLVHRDIKPANLLVDRTGTVKVLDLGLARFFHDEEDNLTQKYDETVLGTADYLAPEQALDSHGVDIRADIYSLGVTFYFLLTGSSPFKEGTVAQKLIWHQMRQPKPIRDIRPEVPEGLAAVVNKMMAKDPAQRYQTPAEVAHALAPWTQIPIAPPTDDEMPHLSRAARGTGQGEAQRSGAQTGKGLSALSMVETSAQPGAATLPDFEVDASRAMPTMVAPTSRPPSHMVGANATPTPGPADTTGLRGKHHFNEQTELSLASGAVAERPFSARQRLDRTDLAATRVERRWSWVAMIAIGVVALVAAAAGLWITCSGPGKPTDVAEAPPTAKKTAVAEVTSRVTGREQPSGSEVSIQVQDNARRITTSTYQAVVAADGCLSSLRINDIEFLKPDVGVSRGGYFYQEPVDAPLALPDVKQAGSDVVTAQSDKALVRYEFGGASLREVVTNKTSQAMKYFFVLASAVKAIENQDGEWAQVALNHQWHRATFFAGPSRLAIRDFSSLQGPWPEPKDNLQVVVVDLAPMETRRLDLTMGTSSAAEAAEVARVTAMAPVVLLPPDNHVVIKQEQNGWRIDTPQYQAFVENQGWLDSLKVGGLETLAVNGPITRGIYFNRGTTLELPAVEGKGTTITARSDSASIRYEFASDTIKFALANSSDLDMKFFMVFAPAVKVATNGQGEWMKLPGFKEWNSPTLFAGTYKLKLQGGNKILGPWQEKYTVYEKDVKAQQTGVAALEIGPITAAEAVKIGETTGTAAPAVPVEPGASGTVVVKPLDDSSLQVQGSNYQALIDKDGAMNSLRVDGVEFLKSPGKITRGAYLYMDHAVQLPEIEQPVAGVVTAKGDMGSVRYEFGSRSLRCTVKNATDAVALYYIVFGPAVTDVKNDKGDSAHLPVNNDWATMTWIAGNTQLTITGSTRTFGPWEHEGGQDQVWELRLGPHEARQVTFAMNSAPAPERGREKLAVQSPQSYQVFQRSSRIDGNIAIRGALPTGCTKVEARLTGKSLDGPLPGTWQALAMDNVKGTFNQTLAARAGGWYTVAIRALKDEQVLAEAAVDHVGVGEVFVIAGQSNSTNYGEELLKPASGLVSSFDGSHWRLANDPQPGAQDNSTGGSPWPAFGDALVEKYHVPIGIASTGTGGTSVSGWQPDGKLFPFMMERIEALGPHGFRALLWHQGESDAGRKTTEEYARLLTNVVKTSKKQAGWDFPWFVARVTYESTSAASNAAIRAAQKRLWDEGTAQEGPDTDTLTGDDRDHHGTGVHMSGKGLRAHGKLWADKVSAYLDKVLGSP